jgi:hypothetical protein
MLLGAILGTRLIVRIVVLILLLLIAPLVILSLLAGTAMQKSMLTWPVAAPTRVAASQPDYLAAGWTISSLFGWRYDPTRPGQYELHEGVDLAGPMFCHGCEVPPMGDIEVAQVGWDQEWSADPLQEGAGVVVDMALQHPEEAGTVRLRYGHLQPYRVSVRTRSCTQTIDCPVYRPDSAGRVSVSCPGRVMQTARSRGMRAFAYATPGQCTASVSWPPEYIPQGVTTITFDQRIVPGAASSDAAITFNAQLPPPPPPITPTISLPLPTP